MNLSIEQIEHLKSLESSNGELLWSVVLEDAKKKTSPLHGLYDWNVKRAAEAHWREVTRDIIQSVRVVVSNQTYHVKAPAYVRDASKGKQEGYVRVNRASPQQAMESLAYTINIAEGHLRRARDIAAALGLESEVDGLLERIAGVRRVIREAA